MFIYLILSLLLHGSVEALLLLLFQFNFNTLYKLFDIFIKAWHNQLFLNGRTCCLTKLGSTSTILVSSQSINFSITDNKNIVKIFVSRSKVLNWLFTWGHDSAITLTQWTLNTDNSTSMEQSFCDTGTLRRQKLPLPVPTMLHNIYIKI